MNLDRDQKDILLVSGLFITALIVCFTAILISQYSAGGCAQ